MTDLKFAVFGTGFWSHYQIPAWFEVGGVDLVAVYNRTVAKAEAVAEKFARAPRSMAIPKNCCAMRSLTSSTSSPRCRRMSRWCCSPRSMACPSSARSQCRPTTPPANAWCRRATDAGIPFYVHENYRWQAPIRELKRIVDEGAIGRPFRGRFQFLHALEPFVWENQPLLKSLPKLIIADQGSHQLDLARFFFGEFQQIHCQHLRVRDDIVAEDVASISLRNDDAIVNVELSFVSHDGVEPLPGGVHLPGRDRTARWSWAPTSGCGSPPMQARRFTAVPPPRYPWADPAYDVNHASMVPAARELPARAARRSAAGKHRRRQPEDHAARLRRLRVGGAECRRASCVNSPDSPDRAPNLRGSQNECLRALCCGGIIRTPLNK